MTFEEPPSDAGRPRIPWSDWRLRRWQIIMGLRHLAVDEQADISNRRLIVDAADMLEAAPR